MSGQGQLQPCAMQQIIARICWSCRDRDSRTCCRDIGSQRPVQAKINNLAPPKQELLFPRRTA
jgi:hypothetical protein